MTWLKNNLAWLLLLLVLGTGTGLYVTGRLEIHWHHQKESEELGVRSEELKTPHPSPLTPHVFHLVDDKLVLDEETVQASGIRTAPVTTGTIAVNLRLTGEVQLAEDRFAHVTPRLPGVIRAVHHSVGDTVSAGTPLCTMESVELGEARAAFVSALAERTLARRNYRRWKQLFEKGLKTQNEFWVAENEFTRARLSMEAAKNKLKALGLENEEIAALERGGGRSVSTLYEVKSPIAGTILERHPITLGEYLAPKDAIFLVGDLSEVWVQAALYERDLPAVRMGMVGVVRPQGFTEARFEGRVTYLGQQVEEKTRTVPLRITVKNGPLPGATEPFALRPALFVTVDLETSYKTGVLLVPHSAVQSVNGGAVVFVPSAVPEPSDHPPTPTLPLAGGGQGGGERESLAFERRAVSLGGHEGEVVEVMQGLSPGERVVVENAYLLKSELERARFADPD
jgi:membrane fusion protein, heavy metal efflux system